MGKIKNTLELIAIILSGTGVLTAGGVFAYEAINQPVDGVDGKDGNVWKVGTANIDTIEVGNEGDFYYDVDDFKLYQVSNGSWVLKVDKFGKPGEQGEQGIQGEKGDQGNQGIQGEQGLKGDTGDQGEQGLKGDTGDQGIKGSDGEKGDTGDKGDKGDQGNPGTNGTNGTDGSSSYVWVKYSNAYPNANADMLDSASNFIGIYSGTASTAPTDFTSYTWFEIKGTKGDKGDTGATGNKGEDGKDGSSVYIGYDGYAWNGNVRTQYKISELDSLCIENTLELYTSNYFETSLVDTISKKIALTGEYYQYINKTIYDGVTLDKITLFTDDNGYLEIGTISLEDGTTSTSKYTVVKGKNIIDLNDLKIDENETLVLGGGETTVKLYQATGVNNVTDTYGNYTVVGDTFTVNNSKTGDVLDKLITNVTIDSTASTPAHYFDNVTTVGCAVSSMSEVSITSYPYRYKNNHFSGVTITEIGIPVIKSNSGEMDLYIVKNNVLDRRNTYVRKITFTLNCAKNSTINDWVYTDLTSYNIVLEDDETLAFGYVTGGVSWGYCKNTGFSADDVDRYSFWDNNSTSVSSGNAILFDIVYQDTATNAKVEKNRQSLVEDNEANKATYLHNLELQALKTVIAGKNVSILGDSISTFSGWSNNATTTNSTIGSNAIYYTGSNIITSVEQTWWKQLINETGTNLLVDNAYSGDKVTNLGQSRCVQLHDDTGDNAGTEPDIILVYLGINDFDNGVTAANFKTGYESMIEKIVNKYEDAEIFLFTLLPNNAKVNDTLLATYNETIRDMETEYGYSNVHIVDLFEDSGITRSNLSSYMGCSQLLHPNAAGMYKMTLCVEEALIDFYCAE